MTKLQAPLPARKTLYTTLINFRNSRGQITQRKLPDAGYQVPSALEVLADVCYVFDLTTEDITKRGRREENIEIKKLYCYVANVLTNERSGEIALLMNRGRGTYLSHVDNCVAMFESNDARFMRYWNKYISKSRVWTKHFNIQKKRQNEQDNNTAVH